ncbi:hypothetical protein GCM10010309_42090 [Streptomyces violaceochromogenes]|nr:hypothetical protein GCM10010309_42090 [Streptomyces violaceochromogenes]
MPPGWEDRARLPSGTRGDATAGPGLPLAAICHPRNRPASGAGPNGEGRRPDGPDGERIGGGGAGGVCDDVRMSMLATIAVLALAALHAYILVLEMFLWTSPRARAAFGTSAEFAASTKALAANQGLYNGFLAAGLAWGAVASDPVGFQVSVFFLVCVAVAGLYGAATASRKILFVQTVPALAALALVLLAR